MPQCNIATDYDSDNTFTKNILKERQLTTTTKKTNKNHPALINDGEKY